jgi:4-oxalocrotonate tautomerase
MPVIEVKLWEGVPPEKKKHIVEGITKACTDVGIPAPAIQVLLIEVKKENWAIGGKMCNI